MMITGTSIADDVNVELVGHFGGNVNGVAIAGGYAYFGQGRNLVILDISDAVDPSEVGRLNTPSVDMGCCCIR